MYSRGLTLNFQTDAPCGIYTLYSNGRVEEGITALARNVPSYAAPTSISVQPNYIFPAAMQGQQITFYAVVVEAGKIPPVSSLAALTSTTQYVIFLSEATATVAP